MHHPEKFRELHEHFLDAHAKYHSLGFRLEASESYKFYGSSGSCVLRGSFNVTSGFVRYNSGVQCDLHECRHHGYAAAAWRNAGTDRRLVEALRGRNLARDIQVSGAPMVHPPPVG